MIADWPTKDVQILVTTACNMACHNCDFGVRIAPNNKEFITLEQIDKFIKESHEMNIQWDRILLIGGEPMVHKQLFQIISRLKRGFNIEKTVKAKGKEALSGRDDLGRDEIGLKTGIGIISNGKYTPEAIKYLELTEAIHIDSDNKKDNNQHFYPVNIAPVDNPNFKESHNEEYANVQKYCQCPGFCLSPNGFYACTTGAGIDRVFGMDVGIKSLKDVNREALVNQFRHLCKYCGYFNEIAPFDVPKEHLNILMVQ